MKRLLAISILVVLILPVSGAQADMYTSRALFEAELGTKIIDDYESSDYKSGDKQNLTDFDIHSDAHMSAVLGETYYTSTGFDNWNIIHQLYGNTIYCTGCNGSTLYDFTSTSIGDATGVFGAGFDIVAGTDYHAFVTFGDNSTQDYALPNSPEFFGITSILGIKSIHTGLAGGFPTTGGIMAIDNLTIGTVVPVPGAVLLCSIGLGFAGCWLKRRSP